MTSTEPSSPSGNQPLPVGFGPFRVLGVLGRGGMGVVYRAEHKETGEKVAVKSVSLARRAGLASIRSEIGTLSRLQHPGIVGIRGHGLEGGIPWYAMELLEGRTLSDFLDELWPARSSVERTTTTMAPIDAVPTLLSPSSLASGAAVRSGGRPPAGAGRMPEVLRLFRQTCEALAYLHGRGIVHRDIKPSNVFVRADGSCVLMDFGLTWRARGSVGREALELGGRLVGTFAYLSPEQINLETIDGRTDLYALGCVLYEAVTGVVPFVGPGHDQLVRQHLTEQPAPPSTLVSGLDERMDRLILGLLAKKRRERIGHAADVAGILADLGGGPRSAEPEGQPYLYRPELTGREEVLTELSAHLARLARRQGSFVCMAGESGIGKTFLAGEVSKRAVIRNLRVVGGECVPLAPQFASVTQVERRGLPLQPLRAFFEVVADYCRERGPACTNRVLGPRAKVIAEHIPALADLPGVATHPDPPSLPPQEAHRRLVDDVRETMAAFAAEDRPLLIVIDDLQWADELSLRLLLALSGDWLAEKGLMILGTYRSDEVGPDLRALVDSPGVHSLNVSRMNARFVGQIAADMLGAPAVPQTLIDFLSQHSEGIPFFVAEYLRTAVSEGLLVREGGHWTLRGGGVSEADLSALPLPSSIQDMMQRRLAGLGEELRALAQVAAVIGREFDLELLAAGAELSDLVTADRAKLLVQEQIFEAPEPGHYRFVHDRLRETAYAGLPAERREELHRVIGRLLEERVSQGQAAVAYGELGHHFAQGKLWDKAVDYLEKAGEQASARFANREAIQFFGIATSLAQKLPFGVDRLRNARWERHLVDSRLGLGQMTEAHTHAERALRLCGYRLPSSRLGWVTGLLAQILLRVVQRILPGPFKVRSDQAQALTNEAAYVLNRLCEPFFLSHKPLQGFYCGFRDLNLAERVAPSEALARGYATMAMVVGIGPLVKLGRTWSNRAIATARTLKNESALIYCLSRSSSLLMTVPDWTLGMERLAEADAKARARSDLRQLGETVTTLGLLTAFRGHFAESLEAAQEIIRIGDFRGDNQLRQWGRNQAVHALYRLGRAREALPLVRALAESHKAEQVGEAEKIFDLGGFALTHLALGEMEQAHQRAVQVLEMIRREPFLPYFLKGGLEGMTEVFLTLLERADRSSPAQRPLFDSAREAVARFQKFSGFYAVARPRTHNLLGRLLWLQGKREGAVLAWKKAMALGEALQIPYEVARARLELGRRLDPGQTEAGADGPGHLAAARAVFAELGAAHDLAVTETALGDAPAAVAR